VATDSVYTAAPIGRDPATPLLPPHLGSYTRALLASKDRRHLFVTPCLLCTSCLKPLREISSLDNKVQNSKKKQGERQTSVLFIINYKCHVQIISSVQIMMRD
jgi:hypothetical protein